MLRVIATVTLSGSTLAEPALSETRDVQTLDSGRAGITAIEPDDLHITERNNVKFIVTDRGHLSPAPRH